MQKPRPFRSLAAKFCWFTASLVGSIFAIELAVDLLRDPRLLIEHLTLTCLLVTCATAVAWVTSRVFIRPLVLLNDAITSVKQGNLEPIRLSATGDEIEKLGESFNQMIEALATSRRQVREHQEQLEQKIRERTKELEQSTERAEAASKAKGEFLANMSHELRTPLNGVLGMIDIVLDSELSDAQRGDLETAKESSVSLLGLVNDILDLAKIEAGKMSLEKVRFSPREIVDGCCKILAPKARQKGLGFALAVQPDVPQHLSGDPLRLHQVLVNLVGNAIKYTQQGYVILRASSRPASTPGSVELRFDVLDTGIGVPRDKLSLIFENFMQADTCITRQYGGTGLGLAICRQLVEMHGGHIWADSEVGRGSAFHFVVELQEAAPPPREVLENGAPEVIGLSPGRQEATMARILIVEDNLTNQKVFAGLLGKRGYQTSVASHGRQALEALEESAFDLILMDVQMPVLDGLEATRLIRQDARWRTLPIIGVTAHAMVGDRERCLEAGMNDYLAKPVRPSALFETVRKCLPSPEPGAAECDPVSCQPQVREGLDVVGLGEQVY